ncbi:hypothetical protein Lfu02_00920 [Longispora fulva]|uniref:Fructose-1,6-bisphosphatase/sedoheptulose 1,7-bisphosphatase-like protein n=1 Tax=Longispora fulva TaxID=619741 RepID=A0A8J7G962_9ACTN|nr:hypothetical protein [Longispora fulva]MBG6136038.1 fructose-1,6-bisphosphatase/sedoheptulose 1,7-bisphosphatase-like protein [Longispora fulva]GIG55720.1 hypothetical protein Lfu02_00920 [Longispora fulva]
MRDHVIKPYGESMVDAHLQDAGRNEALRIQTWTGADKAEHVDAGRAVRWAIDAFHRDRQSSARFLRTTVTGRPETVEMCVARIGQNVEILSQGDLAEEIRTCLPTQGWQTAPLTTPGAALRDIADLLDRRVYNAVVRGRGAGSSPSCWVG